MPALGKSLSEPLNGEVVSGDWRFYADQITTAWRKSVASIIETGAVGARGEKLRRNARVSGLTRLVAFAEDANAAALCMSAIVFMADRYTHYRSHCGSNRPKQAGRVWAARAPLRGNKS